MFVCIYIHIYIYIAYLHTCIYIFIDIQVCMHMHVFIDIRIHRGHHTLQCNCYLLDNIDSDCRILITSQSRWWLYGSGKGDCWQLGQPTRRSSVCAAPPDQPLHLLQPLILSFHLLVLIRTVMSIQALIRTIQTSDPKGIGGYIHIYIYI